MILTGRAAERNARDVCGIVVDLAGQGLSPCVVGLGFVAEKNPERI